MEDKITISGKPFKCLINKNSIDAAIDMYSDQLQNFIDEKDPIIVILMDGAIKFAIDILGQVNFQGEVCCVRHKGFSPYSTDDIQVTEEVPESFKGRNILVLDDILDSGNTMKSYYELLQSHGVKSMTSLYLVTKGIVGRHDPCPNLASLFLTQDQFLVGYGMDYDNKGRLLNHIYVETESL